MSPECFVSLRYLTNDIQNYVLKGNNRHYTLPDRKFGLEIVRKFSTVTFKYRRVKNQFSNTIFDETISLDGARSCTMNCIDSDTIEAHFKGAYKDGSPHLTIVY